MRLFLPLLLVTLASPALAIERRYSVTDFDSVQVDGPFLVTLTTGAPSSARATGSSAALDRLAIDVQGRTLRVRPNASAWGGYPGGRNEPATVVLTTRQIQTATVNGSGSLAIDKAKGLKVTISLAGSGRASIGALDSDSLLVNMLGSGGVTIGGRTKTIRAEVRGAASLDAAQLTAGDAQVITDSAGDIKLAVTRAVTIQASGPGNVDITGSPACTVRSSGVGQISCGKR